MARARTRAAAPMWLHTLCLLVCVWSQVDVDECKDLQSQYGVTAMPTFKMLKGGKEVGSMQGADEGALREKIEALAGKPDRWAAAGSGRQL